ncbi:MAG: nucleotidyltransferase domain-containing protein [Lentimicrobium sp.]
MGDTIHILKELKQYLIAGFGDDIVDVILFGSQVSGKATEGSDFDILLVVARDYNWQMRDRIMDKAFDIGLKYQVLFDIHLLSLNEKRNSLRGKEPVIANAIERGIYA